VRTLRREREERTAHLDALERRATQAVAARSAPNPRLRPTYDQRGQVLDVMAPSCAAYPPLNVHAFWDRLADNTPHHYYPRVQRADGPWPS
jgi:hypothetical protein